MSFIDCVKKQGLLTNSQLKSLEKEYSNLVSKYSESTGDVQAAAEAASMIISQKSNQLKARKRNTLVQAQKNAEFKNKLQENLKNKDRFKLGFTKKQRVKDDAQILFETVYETMENSRLKHLAVKKELFTNLLDFTEKYKSTFGGYLSSTEGMDKIVRELLGESTGDGEALGYAKVIREAMDLAHERYRAAGGSIGKLDNYMPQHHDKSKIKEVSFDEWFEFIKPKLDLDRMKDPDTALPFTDAKLKQVLEGSYDDITTNGRASLKKQIDAGQSISGLKGKDLSYKRETSRFIHFKNADSWLEYNQRFGEGDAGIFDMIMGHLDRMAKDIGTLETMGPKPNAMRRFMQDQELRYGLSKTKRNLLNGVYDVLTDRLGGSDDELGWRSSTLGFAQNIMRAAYLGGASLSAMSDSTFISATAKFNGMSSTRVLKRYAKLMNPLDSSDRNMAKRMGYIADQATGATMTESRFALDLFGNKSARKAAEFTNRMSGLEAITTAGKNAISMEYLGTMADFVNNKTSWNKVDNSFKELLNRYDITEADWDNILKADLVEPDAGVKFYDPQSLLEKIDTNEAMDLIGKIETINFYLRDAAVNEANLMTRAITTGAFVGDASKGTLLRDVSSSVFMFKSFPITVLMNHIIPMVQNIAQGKKLDYAAQIAIGTTLLGGMALQSKEISKGRTPRDMEDFKFWQAAMLQGGGAGIFGDFLFMDHNRFGGGFAETLTGPVVGTANDVRKMIFGNAQKLMEGKETSLTKDAFNFAKRNTPFLNLWYSRLAVDRVFLDHVEKAVDPKFHKNLRRIERRWQRDTGQKYWWRKGQLTP